MPDIAGAMAAIEQRLKDQWTATRIALANETPQQPWPPVDADTQQNLPWVLIEVTVTQSNLRAAGVPGDQFWLYDGLVQVHVFVPLNSGRDIARSYASQIGDLYRNKAFYNDTPGYQVRTLSPRIDGGGAGSDDGAWFRVTATIPFEYYHRG